jgi:hypothetical protein
MKTLKKILAFAGARPELHRESKRAWAEYFEMERKIRRQAFYLKLYHVFVATLLIAAAIDKTIEKLLELIR